MKRLALLCFLMSSVHGLIAQNWCDSTLIACDSIVVDSILFTHSVANGDRVHVAITSNHDWLYAPNFVMCASDEAIAFVNNEHSYFTLYGPISILPYYQFENFEIVGDSLFGNITVDNTNNDFESCIISFNTSVPATTGLENKPNSAIHVFPNPTKDYVTVRTNVPGQIIQQVFLVDNLGKRHQISVVSDRVDIHEMLPGVYLMYVEMKDGQIMTKKIVVH